MTFLRSSRLARSTSSVLALSASLLFIACGDSTTPPATDSGTRTDGNVTTDLGTDDASTETDAQIADASATDAAPSDMCAPPVCPSPPSGCRIEPSADPCLCGEIKCEDGGAPAGAACGGRATEPCGPGLYCDFTATFDCGFADGMGTCAPRPALCDFSFMPVCGCDGMTYSNACVAKLNGTDVQADGECATEPPPPPPPPPPGSDCRSTGCPAGSECQPCRGVGGSVHVCIPDGAVC